MKPFTAVGALRETHLLEMTPARLAELRAASEKVSHQVARAMRRATPGQYRELQQLAAALDAARQVLGSAPSLAPGRNPSP